MTTQPHVPRDEHNPRARAARYARLEGLRPFPAVVLKAKEILSDPAFSLREIERLVESDPILGARVIRVANSAAFCGTYACETLQQAIVRLGARTVEEVILAAAAMELFRDTGNVGMQIRDHCAATASLVRILSMRCRRRPMEGIFLCGLLHDIGKLLLMETGSVFEPPYSDYKSLQPDVVHLCERAEIGFDHGILGAYVLEQWGFPPPIHHAIELHHSPERAYDLGSTQLGMMVAFLRIADHVELYFRRGDGNRVAFFDNLANGADCQHAEISGADLERLAPELLSARAEALSFFAVG